MSRRVCGFYKQMERQRGPIPRIDFISREDQERLERLFDDATGRINIKTEHWLEFDGTEMSLEDFGVDAATSFCRPCSQKFIESQEAEHQSSFTTCGGYATEHDSAPFCEDCGVMLYHTLTDYGIEQELEHFLDHGFRLRSDDDLASMSTVIASMASPYWDIDIVPLIAQGDSKARSEISLYRDLNQLGRRLLLQIDGSWDTMWRDLEDDLLLSHSPG